MMKGSPKLIINKLVLVGYDKNYIIPFHPGINIIYGDSDTGKSSILNLIDYLLGGSKVDTYDEIEKKVKYALLEISLESKTYTIKRNIFNLREYIQVYSTCFEDIENVLPSEYGPNYNKQGPAGYFSDFLLKSLNIPLIKVKEAPTKADSEMKRVSFRDIFKYNYLQQDDVGSKYILDLKSYSVRIKNQETFKFIHNLLDDQIAKINEEISNKLTEKKKHDNEYNTVLSFFRDVKLESTEDIYIKVNELDEKLKFIEQDINQINKEMKSDNKELDEIRTHILEIERNIDEIDREKFIKQSQLERYLILKKIII
jgi:DNA repair ATPase RecN